MSIISAALRTRERGQQARFARTGFAESTLAELAWQHTRGAAGRLQVVGDRATLTLSGVNGTQLSDWLAEARSAARARPLEANLTRGPQGYSGSIVVAFPSGAVP